MKRFIALTALAFAVAPAIAEDTASIKDDYSKIDGHMRTRPRDRAGAAAWQAKGKEVCNEFLTKWESKATGEEHFMVVKAYLALSQMDSEKSDAHLRKAKAHCDETLKANPEHPDAKMLGGRLEQMLKMNEARAAADKKRQELVGKTAPAIDADEVLDGKPISLDGLKGKVVILDFWATWCPPCRAVIPHLVELQAKHKDAGLEVLGLTRFYGYGFVPEEGSPQKGTQKKNLSEDDEREVNRQCAKALGMKYPIVFSKKAGGTYCVSGIPQLVVIDRKGVVRKVQVGAGDHTELDKLIEQCLAETVAPAGG